MTTGTTTTARERPILFSGPMIRKIIADEKGQTRRVVKPQPSNGARQAWCDGEGRWRFAGHRDFLNADLPTWTCPYGEPGDLLWVRESFMYDPPRDGSWPHYCDQFVMADIPARFRNPRHIIYRCDPKWVDHQKWAWKPSIHMPRWASRLTLRVESVRVERLDEISEWDAYCEGVPACEGSHVASFGGLWDSINGKRRGCSWADNPWVWAITFSRVADGPGGDRP